jgi:hypothetical protein
MSAESHPPQPAVVQTGQGDFAQPWPAESAPVSPEMQRDSNGTPRVDPLAERRRLALENVIGRFASLGICEPAEGFADSPESLPRAVDELIAKALKGGPS